MIKWKVFFWVIVATLVSTSIFHIMQGKSASELLISIAVSAVLLTPYFGHAYGKKIAASLVWKTTFILQVIVTLIVVIFSAAGQYVYINSGGDFFYGFLKVISLVSCAFLLLIPPYLYAFKSKVIWMKRS